MSLTTPAALPVRDALRALSVYSPGTVPCAVDLSDNTNLWGTPPAAAAAIAAVADVARYPEPYAPALGAALAAYAGVRPEEIVTGAGSDDVLYSAIRAFGEPGDRVAFATPTFSMMPVFTRLAGLEPVGVPLGPGWSVDADALLATGAKIIYLCSPNNPTGTLTAREAILRVVERAPGIVILDEAYAEFAPETFVARAPGWERVLVTRTLSKAFGLAGLRVGYGAGSTALVGEVMKARGPYMVSAVADRAALAAVTTGLPWVRARAAEAVAHRERLAAALAARGLAPAPSGGNFVFVPTPDAERLAARAAARGVAIRRFTGLPTDVPELRASGGEGLRIGVGPWAQMEAALAALTGEGA